MSLKVRPKPEASVTAEVGGPMDAFVVGASGELRHWQSDLAAREAWRATSRPDLEGSYEVDSMTVDVTELGAARALVDDERITMGWSSS